MEVRSHHHQTAPSVSSSCIHSLHECAWGVHWSLGAAARRLLATLWVMCSLTEAATTFFLFPLLSLFYFLTFIITDFLHLLSLHLFLFSPLSPPSLLFLPLSPSFYSAHHPSSIWLSTTFFISLSPLLYLSLPPPSLPDSLFPSPLPLPLSLFIIILTSSQSALTRRSRKITSPLFRFSSALPLPRKSNIAWDTRSDAHTGKKPHTRVSERREERERSETDTFSTKRDRERWQVRHITLLSQVKICLQEMQKRFDSQK